jgi:hypothetical protein
LCWRKPMNTCRCYLRGGALFAFNGQMQQASLLAHNLAHSAKSPKKQGPVYN